MPCYVLDFIVWINEGINVLDFIAWIKEDFDLLCNSVTVLFQGVNSFGIRVSFG